jgi:tetratricopeptide (TPR) repeat protein
MLTVPQALDLAVKHHQAGQLRRAEQIYRQILEVEPRHADALHLLGVIAYQLGHHDLAIDYVSRAVSHQPDHAEAHNTLGVALWKKGQLREAAASYRQALRVKPHYAEAHNNLGIVLREQGELEEAATSYRQALRLRPDYAEAHNNLANALRDLGRLDEAVAGYEQALRLKPDYAEAHSNRGIALRDLGRPDEAVASHQQALRLRPDYAEAHNNLGVALKDLGRLDEAVSSYREALRLRPKYVEAYDNLATALRRQGKLEEAVAAAREAVRLKPDHAEAHNGLGTALLEQGRLEEALAHVREALRLKPNFAEAYTNLGNALMEQGRLEEAAASHQEALRLKTNYSEGHSNLAVLLMEQGKLDEAAASHQRALALQPGSPAMHKNLAITWLLMGDFERGWPEYEWRWKCEEASPPPFPQPPWDGSDLRGRTILLHAEQGLGDTLQFVRYAPLVKRRGGTALVKCQQPLVRLLRTCAGIDRLAASEADLPPFDTHAPLLSLPRIFQTTLATVPADVPYLSAPAELVGRWRGELGGAGGLRVGIAWQGSPTHKRDRRRSVPLTHFLPLARLEGVRLVSLQKGHGAEQLAGLADRHGIIDLGARLTDFADTAAVMRNLDLVITVDTAVAHLAGALGVPVWVALPSPPDWRWLLGRPDSPWYPTMRLFRQRESGHWDDAFADLARELARLAAAPRRARPVLVEIAPGQLVDRITILEIKSERLTGAEDLRAVRDELDLLRATREKALPPSERLAALTAELKAVNAALWEARDAIDRCERAGDFGPHFVELARALCRQNDRRKALKGAVNELLGWRRIDESSAPVD